MSYLRYCQNADSIGMCMGGGGVLLKFCISSKHSMILDAVGLWMMLIILGSKSQVFQQFWDFTTLLPLNSLGQEMSCTRWHPVMLNSSMQRPKGLLSDFTSKFARGSPKKLLSCEY